MNGQLPETGYDKVRRRLERNGREMMASRKGGVVGGWRYLRRWVRGETEPFPLDSPIDEGRLARDQDPDCASQEGRPTGFE